MRTLFTVAKNGFMELIRQPIFLLLMTTSSVFEVFLACVNYFGFGDEPKLVKNSVLAIMFLAGLFGAVLSASAAVAREIRTGTALAVLAKPVGKAQFLFGKFFGLLGALAVMSYVNTISALLASRMAFDAYGDVDFPALFTFLAAVAAGYLIAGFTNFFLRRPFMADAVLSLVITITIGFLVMGFFFQRETNWLLQYEGVDWRLLPASLLIFFALAIIAAIALAASTRLETIPTLAICSGLFLLGLMSDYLLGRRAEAGSWWASILYAMTPNWQLFWLADVLETGKKFPMAYLGKAFAYMVAYVGAALSLALFLFEDRELS
jgi:ABC-type transport system involved in multi-copper enzyme maturation permease subunit